MKILGLNLGHDSSCTLLVDGKIIAACEEERYSKQKHTRSFPINAIKDCLKIGKRTGVMRTRFYILRDQALFIYNNKNQKYPSLCIFLKGMYIN